MTRSWQRLRLRPSDPNHRRGQGDRPGIDRRTSTMADFGNTERLRAVVFASELKGILTYGGRISSSTRRRWSRSRSRSSRRRSSSRSSTSNGSITISSNSTSRTTPPPTTMAACWYMGVSENRDIGYCFEKPARALLPDDGFCREPLLRFRLVGVVVGPEGIWGFG